MFMMSCCLHMQFYFYSLPTKQLVKIFINDKYTTEHMFKVSYLTALDVYLWTCYLFVFSTVLEFCILNYVMRKRQALKDEVSKNFRFCYLISCVMKKKFLIKLIKIVFLYCLYLLKRPLIVTHKEKFFSASKSFNRQFTH